MVSFNIRIRTLFIICSSVIYHFALDIEYARHQKLPILVISINSIIVITFEFFFQYYYFEDYVKELFYALLLILIENIFFALHCTEAKYLMDIQYLNQYKFLYIEGLFGLIISLLVSTISGSYEELKAIDKKDLFIIIFLFFLYFILCGLKNIFAYTTIKLYSPITYAMSELLFVPFLVTYHYIISEEKYKNIIHFIINITLSIINLFFSCVYNELIILNFCKLEYSTYPFISSRAIQNVRETVDVTMDGQSLSLLD
jgi:hypothetical protein